MYNTEEQTRLDRNTWWLRGIVKYVGVDRPDLSQEFCSSPIDVVVFNRAFLVNGNSEIERICGGFNVNVLTVS